MSLIEDIVCYSKSTENESMECANGKFGLHWNGCIDQDSVRIRCPKGSVPCNEAAITGEAFTCYRDCSKHGGRKNCTIEGMCVVII